MGTSYQPQHDRAETFLPSSGSLRRQICPSGARQRARTIYAPAALERADALRIFQAKSRQNLAAHGVPRLEHGQKRSDCSLDRRSASSSVITSARSSNAPSVGRRIIRLISNEKNSNVSACMSAPPLSSGKGVESIHINSMHNTSAANFAESSATSARGCDGRVHYPVPVNGTGQSASPFWLPLPATEAARLLGKGGKEVSFPSLPFLGDQCV